MKAKHPSLPETLSGSVRLTRGSYEDWRSTAESLLKPLVQLMEPGKADLPLVGQASSHGTQADRLESFARPCLLAAHWLASEPGEAEEVSREALAEWFRRGLVIGTDPASPEYWGPTANHHQHTVEMAALTLALQAARSVLWEPFTRKERDQVAGWLASIRGVGLHRNNHMFFNVMTQAFLEQEGYARPGDAAVMRHLLDVIESMALGGGWFIDGMNETIDYYQAYAFHYYGPWWAKLYGHTDPKRAQRWKDWLAEFLPDYVHFFAASGENPPFGRSTCYRFAASAPFGLAEYCGVRAIPPGQARRLCSRNVAFFLNRPVFQSQGALSLGWTDEFPELSEAYSCAGSPYWAAKGFAPLLLSPDHAFWKDAEEPLPCEVSDHQLAVPQAGLVVRSHSGEVEVLNNANGICVGNIKFGTWKWGKLSFRSGVGGEIGRGQDAPLDAALTAEFEDAAIAGRHQCQPLAVEADHCGSVYALGDRFSQHHVSVETRIWWKAGWQFHWHHIVAYQPSVLRLGSYSLPIHDEESGYQAGLSDEFGWVRAADTGIAVQPLSGFAAVDERKSEPRKRTHLLAEESVLLVAETDWITGEHDLVALTWIGKAFEKPTSWTGTDRPAPWTVVSTSSGKLTLTHPNLGPWEITCPGLPELSDAASPRGRAQDSGEFSEQT